MNLFAIEEFTSRRRKAQERIEDALRPVVKHALDHTEDTNGYEDLLHEVAAQYEEAYYEETGDHETPPTKWLNSLRKTLKKTKGSGPHSVDRVSTYLATAILSEATTQAAIDDDEDLFLEWVDMHDSHVRPTHKQANGQVRPIGEKFKVGGYEMSAPGDVTVPMELWINCRCTVRPVLASEASLVAAAPEPEPEPEPEPKDNPKRNVAMVALPHPEDPIHKVGDEEKHVTLLYLQDPDDDTVNALHGAAEYASNTVEPFTAPVIGKGTLGPDDAKVLHVQAHDLNVARGIAHQDDAVNAHLRKTDTHPHFVPHLTTTYGEEPDTADVSEIGFDRLGVWDGDDRTEYPLGGDMPDKKPDEEPEAKPGKKPDDAPFPPKDEEEEKKPKTEAGYSPVPFHAVLAPEGKWSGDGRRFRENSLSTRPLPLPFTWQKQSAGGHDGNITVAKIEQMARVDGQVRATGHFLAIPEADEAIGLIGEFGRFGVSVDADRSEFELAEDDEGVDFLSARICSACIVSIPAFAEAWASLGEAPEGFMDGEQMQGESEEEEKEEDEALVASLTDLFTPKVDIFKDLAPGRTEDGPGWLTHPVDTDRLRDYWVRGPGAAKIGWGTEGDFNRCRAATAEYVKPQYLSGYCANRHYDALGFWPGRPVAGDTTPFAYETLGAEDKTPAEPINLVASVFHKAPAAWFKDPEFAIDDDRMVLDPSDGTWGCAITVTDEGQVYGHIAKWGTCHLSYAGVCTTAPHSSTDYAYFLSGQVPLDDGTRAATGVISMGGGHADGHLSRRRALAHYDSTSTAVADVTVGEDQFGIWMAGWVRPGTTPEQINALMASRVSGDWRRDELCAVLAVNVPGFSVIRPRVAAANGEQISLVAAGMVEPPEGTASLRIDADIDAFADKIALAIATLGNRRTEMAALAASFKEE